MTTKYSNSAVTLPELGAWLARYRVQLGLTQAQLAEEAGLGKRTVERLESGNSIQTAGLLRILRVLGLQDALSELIPEPGPRPMDLLKMKGKERQRASSKKPAVVKPDEQWTWGDEE